MRVSNCLACSLANVDPDVVTVRRAACFDVAANYRNKGPNCRLFITGEGKKVGLMSPRNDQAMSLI
jgi:hypothetical protein